MPFESQLLQRRKAVEKLANICSKPFYTPDGELLQEGKGAGGWKKVSQTSIVDTQQDITPPRRHVEKDIQNVGRAMPSPTLQGDTYRHLARPLKLQRDLLSESGMFVFRSDNLEMVPKL
jgi:hypothetical protein